MPAIPSEVKRGEPISHEHHNALVRLVRSLIPVAGPGVSIRVTPAGTSYSVDVPRAESVMLGVVASTVGQATIAGSTISYGEGTAYLYRDGTTAKTIVPQGGAIPVCNDLEESFPPGTRVRLGRYLGRVWVLGRVCPQP